MTVQTTQPANLRRSITREASLAIGFHPSSWQEKVFSLFFWLPAQRFARLAAALDARIGEQGLSSALRWILPRFANQVTASGVENIPQHGPVLLVSNHPGAFDGVVILAQMPRDDVKLIASDVPFTRGLTAASRHLIYSTGEDMHARMNAVRQSIRQLHSDGVVMLFPTGLVEPDPSFMPGAMEALNDWSPSLAYMLHKAPETRVLPIIVSGVIAPRYMENPFARRQPTTRQRQKVAEYFEIVQLFILQRELGLYPQVSFGQPLSFAEGNLPDNPSKVMERIIASASELLQMHCAQAGY
jgi:hypothetical protein